MTSVGGDENYHRTALLGVSQTMTQSSDDGQNGHNRSVGVLLCALNQNRRHGHISSPNSPEQEKHFDLSHGPLESRHQDTMLMPSQRCRCSVLPWNPGAAGRIGSVRAWATHRGQTTQNLGAAVRALAADYR